VSRPWGGGGLRGRQNRSEPRCEILLAHPARLSGVDFIEPGVGQSAHFVRLSFRSLFLSPAAIICAANIVPGPNAPRPGAAAGGLMVGIGGGVNARQALAGPHEFEQRLLAESPPWGSLGSSRKAPVVLSRNTRSYCFRFGRVNDGGVVRNRCGPRAGLDAKSVRRSSPPGDAGVHKARWPWPGPGSCGPASAWLGPYRAARPHLLNVFRFGCLGLGARPPPKPAGIADAGSAALAAVAS